MQGLPGYKRSLDANDLHFTLDRQRSSLTEPGMAAEDVDDVTEQSTQGIGRRPRLPRRHVTMVALWMFTANNQSDLCLALRLVCGSFLLSKEIFFKRVQSIIH